MERRRSNRFFLDRPVRVTLLTPNSARDLVFEARMLDLSENGMRVLLDAPVAAGSPIRVDADSCIFLGEVCYCAPDPEGGWSAGVVLEQPLDSLEDLARLTEALMDEGHSRSRSVA